MIITLQTILYFRESFLNVLDRLLRPYYTKFSLAFGAKADMSEDEESDEQVFAEFDEERGVVFYPPMYLQRYAAVSDCLTDERWCGKLEKVVDLGYHDMSFIKYLIEVQGIKRILGVDIESIPLRCSSGIIGSDDHIPKRENPMEVTLFKGNAADPDYRLIGCDAVVAIEMIEHMLPHDLERLIHTVFGFVKPRIAIFTTPNGDFNILFKALEKNGLRRLDHFFEWTQEQFHDWCRNIVVRYPQYTVSCKGIGPGPAGTEHLGCCSQMALFIAKDYSKQQDLHLNSLVLVQDMPGPNSISNLISSWETVENPNENHIIESPKTMESYSELTNSSGKLSSIAILLNSSSLSLVTIQNQDKTFQCNLDTESEKSYLMFDYDQMYFDVLTPRRKVDNRVYDIEDVYSRLNCTTLQVRKFSKTTQNLMAKNKSDSLVYTREVVDEIRHLTKLLNFSKEHNQLDNGSSTWYNINWGENAPYWNQYYKVVKEYIYPFETKSEESCILDLLSDEINRLIDGQFEEDFSYESNKLEVPIEHLMSVVEHITDDVDKVKDLLEWNGYEVSGDIVIHSRALVDYSSVGTETDSMDPDMYSDWDSTDIRSTSMSDGSTVVPDYYARCLRRALDQKVRSLRTMLTADEDITTELDRVVCRLMKLALRTSKGLNAPPPTKWMQSKLLDLLTLTEKAIERRKRHFIESFPLNAIDYEKKSEKMAALDKIKNDNTALKIVNKYKCLVKETDECLPSLLLNLNLEGHLGVSSTDVGKDYGFSDKTSTGLVAQESTPESELFDSTHSSPDNLKLERTLAWVEDDMEVVSYPEHNTNFDTSARVTNDYNTRLTKYYKKKFKPIRTMKSIDSTCVVCKKSHSKQFRKNKIEDRYIQNASKTNLVKKISRKKSSNNTLGPRSSNKFVSVDNKSYRVKPRRKPSKGLYPTASKPIPLSLIELCHPQMMTGNDMGFYNNLTSCATCKVDKHIVSNRQKTEIAATTRNQIINIVTEDADETIALRRTIGTDADVDSMALEDETLIRSVSNTYRYDDNIFDKHNVSTENLHSQTIFLYDIDEPSTSKGIRHIGMDVQCGPDVAAPTYSMLSATTSLTKVPKLFTAGIKIEDSTYDIKIKSADCGVSTNDADNAYKYIVPRVMSLGIKIKKSDSIIFKQMEYTSMPANLMTPTSSSLTRITKMFKEYTPNVPKYRSEDKKCSKDTEQYYVSNTSSQPLFTETMSLLHSTPIKNFKSSVSEKMECSTVTLESGGTSNASPTTLLKSSCRYKTDDSFSDICVRDNSCSIIMPQQLDYLHNEDLHILAAISDNTRGISGTLQVSEYAKSKLCNGGIQVHSYREKQLSEDIMYQGEWQKNIPKVQTQRKFFNPVVVKKMINPNTKREHLKETITTIKIKSLSARVDKKVSNKSLSSRVKNIISNREPIKIKTQQGHKTPKEVGVARIRKPFRHVLKVPSKITMSSVSSKNSKSRFLEKKPPTISNLTATKNSKSTVLANKLLVAKNVSLTNDEIKPTKFITKNYIPLYLRQKAIKSTNDDLTLSFNSPISGKISISKNPNVLNRKKSEVKRDLLRYRIETIRPKYVVFRNEVEMKKSENDGQQIINNTDTSKNRESSRHQPVTPTSTNSSTCSSPCSIATVRAVTVRTKNTKRRKSSLSYTSRTGNSGSENTPADRHKKIFKKYYSTRTTQKISDNKENIPQTSKQFNVRRKESDICKGTFMGQKKDVYSAHLKETTPVQSIINTSSKHKAQKSSANTPKALSASSSSRSSSKLENLTHTSINNEVAETSQTSDLVLVIETQPRRLQSLTGLPMLDNVNVVNHRLVSNWIDNSNKIPVESQSCKTASVMRNLVDETLDFIADPFENRCEIDSETVILNQENLDQRINFSSSETSFKTVITTDENYKDLQDNVEYALDCSFDTALGDESVISLTDTRLTVTDFDAFSFISNTSSPKFSEYLADNECSSSHKDVIPTVNSTGVCEIYERKDQPFQPAPIQNTSRALAIQAFSGFSINGDRNPGDQPDPINFIDSETGSLATDVARQATSEELLTSGRSSDSLESCLLDEDSVVPNWLFQIISQQQSAMDDLEVPEQLMIPLPVAEPMYDDNGNTLEERRAGAGAGDGCGIHSDPSQDSSGRGTSISSSETSSGPESEAVDPSSFVGQFELLREAVASSVVLLASHDPEAVDIAMASRQGPIESNTLSFSRGEARRGPRAQNTTASDVDADISSLDTDVPDSSDN